MSRKIIAIMGVPGSGKSSLMLEFLKQYDWEEREPEKLLRTLYSKPLDLHVFGIYKEGETFPGTDKLSMAVQPAAKKFISETSSNVLFEGDRLSNASFFDFLSELPDTSLSIIQLMVREELLKGRYEKRGSNQNEQFLKSRETKISNITKNFNLWPFIEIWDNNTLSEQEKNLSNLLSRFQS